MFTLLCSLLGLLVGSFVIAMSLFGSLPPPTAKRAAEEAAAEEQEQEVKRLRASGGQGPGSRDIHSSSVANGVSQPLPLLLLPAADAQQAPQPPPAEQQQQQEEGEQAAAETGEQPPGTAGPPPHTSGGQDQVAAALRKIASHISHPKKFPKASELLRQLFGQGALRAEHGPLAFSALKAAMRDPQRAHDPQLAREYSKLFTVASKHAEVRHHTSCPCSLLYLFGGGWVGGWTGCPMVQALQDRWRAAQAGKARFVALALLARYPLPPPAVGRQPALAWRASPSAAGPCDKLCWPQNPNLKASPLHPPPRRLRSSSRSGSVASWTCTAPGRCCATSSPLTTLFSSTRQGLFVVVFSSHAFSFLHSYSSHWRLLPIQHGRADWPFSFVQQSQLHRALMVNSKRWDVRHIHGACQYLWAVVFLSRVVNA